MELEDLSRRAMAVRQQYAEFEQSTYGRSWSREEVATGFVGDVGDLMKLIMACSGVRAIPDLERKLAHELSDCLWSILVLSKLYAVDLEGAFLQAMDEIEQHLASRRRELHHA